MAKQIKNKEIKLKDLSISKELALRFESGNFIVPTDFESWNLVLLTEFITENYAHNDLFEELKKQVFSKYHVPSSIDKHKLSPDVSAALKSIGFYTLNDIFSNRKEVYSTFSSDSEAIEEINNLFSLYSVEPLSFLDGLTVASDALGNLPLPPESLSPAYHEIAEEEVKEKEISVKERIDSQLSKEKRNRGIKQYSHFKIRLASSNEIKLWSYGEVTNHNTINYRTGKPEEGGLFCEKIFGPTKDYECNCGKKNRADKETVCPKCGIEITESKVRRERMGHIHLSAPVVHTWYLKNNPYILRRILKFPPSVIDAIVSRKKFIIIETSTPDITLGALMDEQQYAKYNEKYKGQFKALTGAEAIAFKLKEVDLAKESAKAIKILESSKYDLDTKEINMYRKEIKSNYINQTTLPKEISQIIYFDKLLKSDNKLEWMVLNNIPVIPPDLRPMVALDGGRYATTGLNDLYRKIINRNIRLKKMIDQNSPSIIINNEKRMIQQSVDELFLPSEKNSTVGGKKVKAISEYLRGKEGIMRQNLLGKRVDYSARSVIIVGPDLEMHQCGLPRDIAVVLFKPFIIRELNKKYKDQEGKDTKTKNTSKIYDALGNDVWEALEKVVKEHPVLLNRAPTLHRLSIQAFEPKLIDGKAIR
ncbi:MAG: DNA-directed RNA polymerase subunit beta', partial [Acholeplasmatales bacterium]|nr:DNA-directed RNA polymerase subunit beta' [Acholeplasmatales bacterium]